MTDNELEEFFGNIKEMCNSKGYKAFCEDLELQISNINSVEYTKNDEDLNFRKGQLNIIRMFLNLENSIKVASEQAFVEDTNA